MGGQAPPLRWIGGSPALERVALSLLCAAYVQGSLTKLFDWPGAVAEMERFGLSPAPFFAGSVIAFELICSGSVIVGRLRWLSAILLAGFTLAATLVAFRFWELPPGSRTAAANAFFEHLGLVGGFLIVACHDLTTTRTLAT